MAAGILAFANRPSPLVNQAAERVVMVEQNKPAAVTMEELFVTTLATSDVLVKLLIEKGIIKREDFLRMISPGCVSLSIRHDQIPASFDKEGIK